jgi:hypothetical protein
MVTARMVTGAKGANGDRLQFDLHPAEIIVTGTNLLDVRRTVKMRGVVDGGTITAWKGA